MGLKQKKTPEVDPTEGFLTPLIDAVGMPVEIGTNGLKGFGISGFKKPKWYRLELPPTQ